METNKQEYYRLKEDISILNKLGKQIDTITDIINIYGLGDMPLGKVREFLADRFIKFDNAAFERFDDLITRKNQSPNEKEEYICKKLKELKMI